MRTEDEVGSHFIGLTFSLRSLLVHEPPVAESPLLLHFSELSQTQGLDTSIKKLW